MVHGVSNVLFRKPTQLPFVFYNQSIMEGLDSQIKLYKNITINCNHFLFNNFYKRKFLHRLRRLFFNLIQMTEQL